MMSNVLRRMMTFSLQGHCLPPLAGSVLARNHTLAPPPPPDAEAKVPHPPDPSPLRRLRAERRGLPPPAAAGVLSIDERHRPIGRTHARCPRSSPRPTEGGTQVGRT